MKALTPGWYQSETIRAAKAGDRESALLILEDIAFALESDELPHHAYVQYLVQALRGAVEKNESLDAGLNVAKGKGRPPMLWESHPGLVERPQIMNQDDRRFAIAEAVGWKRRAMDKRETAIAAVAAELCMSRKAVESAYDEHRETAELLIQRKLRQPP